MSTLVSKQCLPCTLETKALVPHSFDPSEGSLDSWRSIHLKNLPPDATVTSILNLVTTGLVENMRHLAHKNEAYISFLNHAAAADFFASLLINGPMLGQNTLDVSWAQAPPLSKEVARAVKEYGACRNVYLGNLPLDISEKDICQAVASCGLIETIRVNYTTHVAFVHFQSIASAMRAVKVLQLTPPWSGYKISYGKDRCVHFTRLQRQTAAVFFGISSKSLSTKNLTNEELARTLAQQSSAAISVAAMAGGLPNVGNRCVLMYNLPEDVGLDEICNATRGGILEALEYQKETKTCFVTFVDPIAAAQFFALWNLNALTIRQQKVMVTWGPHSGPLRQELSDAINRGASRNVYLGRISEYTTKEELMQDFSAFGTIEQINFLNDHLCAFVNFTSLWSAINAVESMPKTGKYSAVRIRYGKDRCGRQPRLIHNGRLIENMPLGWVLFEYLRSGHHYYNQPPVIGAQHPVFPQVHAGISYST